ncbi:hypothetical protein [Paracidovorax sp. MALMAid1276]|uniref:hypothetical protein n=1 Tax=Paracidovorax sp. MALMAid1276 TaxID=3411631 RepID=UPI003B9C8EC0
MNATSRLSFPHSRPRFLRRALALGLTCALLGGTLPASAQVQGALGGMRTFPDAALRGTLTITAMSDATLNGRAIRMAPGMRLFSPQNTLVMAHSVLGQSFKVNYLIEPSTGMLLTAWILSQGEADQPRKGSDTVDRNYRSEYDAVTK